jgi:radical SAM superfamily enzyme YgiQ (UPF0313 family)
MNSNIRLLLITPSALDSHGRPVKLKKLLLPSITMPVLAALTPGYIHTRIVYETVEEIPFEEHWDLVGITGMGSGTVRAWQIADKFRKLGVKVVIGGVGPTIFEPEIILQHADSIVIGEAEETWPILIEDFRNFKMKRIYKAEKPPDVSSIPTPRFDLMNIKKMGYMRSIEATRGCPFYCVFCSVAAFYKGNYRKRPVDMVIQDVRAAKATGSKYIVFIDNNLWYDHDYNQELWEALVPEKIIWISSSTIHIADYLEMILLAHKSGCRMLSIGIESLDKENLRNINKSWNNPDEYTKAIDILRKNGVMVSPSFMLGMDNDTVSIFGELFDFIMKIHAPVPRILIFTPIPGTRLYDTLVKENRIINHDYSMYTGGNVVFQPKNMSAMELKEGYWKLYKDLFTVKNIFRRMSDNIIGQSPVIIAGLFVTNFHYRKHLLNGIVPGIT